MIDKVNICNVFIDNLSSDEVIKRIEAMIKKKDSQFAVTPNVDHIIKLQSDEYFKKIYENAELVLADGTFLLWAAKFLGTPLKEKISGSDLFPKLCKLSAEKGYKVFFLGGRSEASVTAKKVLQNRYTGLDVVGTYSPPYGFESDPVENKKIIKLIKNCKPDILFVGLGAPKQEKWIYSHKAKYQVPLSIGIGVSFEFVAGVVKRAPIWMQKIGLEWLWRVLMEPRRLWRRYFVDDMKIFGLVLKQKLKVLFEL